MLRVVRAQVPAVNAHLVLPVQAILLEAVRSSQNYRATQQAAPAKELCTTIRIICHEKNNMRVLKFLGLFSTDDEAARAVMLHLLWERLGV